MAAIKPPNGLQVSGRKFYRKVLNDYVIEESHDLERLFQACRCLDEIDEAEKVLKTEGRFIFDRFKQRKEHPAAKAIRDHRILFVRILRELCLDTEDPKDGPSRPPHLQN